MTEFVLAFFIVSASFLLLSVGVIFARKRLRGTCGGSITELKEEAFSCGVCAKKEAEICESEDEEGFARLAQIGYPNKR